MVEHFQAPSSVLQQAPCEKDCDTQAIAQTPEDAKARLKAVVEQVPRHRGMFIRLLTFCKQRRTLEEAETQIASYPEYPQAAQSPYHLIMTMVNEGGLRWIELDAQGQELTDERKAGLTEDEIDDIIDVFAVQTTEIGEDVAQELSPESRLRALFDKVPQRLGAYLDVIDFCTIPRSYKEVDTLLRVGDALRASVASNSQPLQPSFFLDMLERNGGLVWKDGWIATGKGKELAKTLRAAMA